MARAIDGDATDVQWWKGKSKISAAPPEYSKVINAFTAAKSHLNGPLMTVTSTKVSRPLGDDVLSPRASLLAPAHALLTHQLTYLPAQLNTRTMHLIYL